MKFKYECECGQMTHFIIGDDGIAHRDTAIHGKGYDRESCLNCNKPIVNPGLPPEKVKMETVAKDRPLAGGLSVLDKQKKQPKKNKNRSK